MATTGERMSRLEGAHEHLASKADVERVRAELAALKSEMMVTFAEMQQPSPNSPTRWLASRATWLPSRAMWLPSRTA